MHRTSLWSASVARRSLMGKEATHNPSPAASALLGKRRVARAKRRLRLKGRKSAHRGNPLPAVASILSGGVGGVLTSIGGALGISPGRFKAPSEKRAARVIPGLIASALGGNLTAAAAIVERATSTGGAGVTKGAELVLWKQAAAQLPAGLVASVQKYFKQIPHIDHSNPEMAAASALAQPFQIPGSGKGQSALEVAQNYLSPGNVVAVARAVSRTGRRRRSRYPTYTDRYGRQRYSTKEPGSQMRLPAGASIAAGTPYSFFSGAVGKGSAGQTAGQLGVAVAAGTAAYFATRAVLRHFGGRALAAEEGGVAAALAFREARADFKAARGRAPTTAEVQEMGRAYKAQLATLGYNAQGVRTRSATEQFLSDYAPED